MKKFCLLLICILKVSSATSQWRSVDFGKLDGSSVASFRAMAVHDTFLFLSSQAAEHVFRYTLATAWVGVDDGLPKGTTAFSSLGRYFYAKMGVFQYSYRTSNDGSS